MISIPKIIEVLFPNEETKAAFIGAVADHTPTIPGESFEDKLHNLIHFGSERSVQIILAPFLRERVYAYLKYQETEEARDQKNEYITTSGSYLYEQITKEYTERFDNYSSQEKIIHIASSIYEKIIHGDSEDFDNYISEKQLRDITANYQELRDRFIQDRGCLAWDTAIRNANEGNEICEEFSQLKHEFLQTCSNLESDETPIDSRQLWERIYHTTPATQEFDELRKHYIEIWGETQWHDNHTTESQQAELLTLSSDSTSREEEFGLPSIPTAEESFTRHKNEYLLKHGIQAWQTASAQPPVPVLLLNRANELKRQFIAQNGQKEWWRIHRPPEHVAAFDMMKKTFIERWNTETWELYSQASEAQIADLNNDIARDFEERKTVFIDKYRNMPNGWNTLWEQAKVYPAIPPAALDIVNQNKARFIEHWGTEAWNEYLLRHRQSTEYATDKQLKVLAELFNLRIEVTTINGGVENTTQHFGNDDAQTIHLYCQDFTHYYVHEDGYHDTIGDGSCGYNGFAQWLKFLILGITPRRAVILPDSRETNPDSYALVQKALQNSMTGRSESEKVELDSSMQEFLANEELTVLRIRKELELPYSFASSEEFSVFLQSKTQELIRITRAKKLPYNRVPLLEKISTLIKVCGEQNKQKELNTLQSLLVLITKTLYLPNTKGVDSKWTDVHFKENITDLQIFIQTQLSVDIFKDLAQHIHDTKFNDLASEPALTAFFAPKPQISHSNFSYHSFNNNTATPPEEDCLSATLCIAGIFLLISGLACMTGLIFIGLLSGTSYLSLLLLNIGLQSIATTLGAVIGLSTANSAILVAVTGATMLSGLGFNLFKDFAPPSMLAHSPIFSMVPF